MFSAITYDWLVTTKYGWKGSNHIPKAGIRLTGA